MLGPVKAQRSWQATRKLVIARSLGWCEECGKERGAHVHHKRYHKNGRRGGEPLEWLQHLCLACHGKKHPNHKFYPREEQQARAKKRKRKGRQPCAYCANRFSREKHERICVRFGLTTRGLRE